MKILFLIPPSEGKKTGGEFLKEELSFIFKIPYNLSINVSEKDLKCKGARFEEALFLNKSLLKNKQGNYLEAIKRYSGVMYNSINYSGLNNEGKEFFEKNFLICSGIYGLLRPLDKIGNYKLPIESKGLYEFWGTKIIENINELHIDYVVNLLPISYGKLIFGKTKKLEEIFNRIRKFKIININFLKKDGNKISHGIKKIRGEWIKDICEKEIVDYRCFGENIVALKDDIIDVNIFFNNL